MKRSITIILAIFSFSALASENLGNIKPIALVAFKKNSEQYNEICKITKHCKNGTTLWKDPGRNDLFYLITPPSEFVKVIKTNGTYKSNGSWHFDTYSHSNDNKVDNDELSSKGVFIYPALYPLSKTKQAVALVYKWSTSYSGGGREEEYADFVMINNDGSYEVAFKNIPFSSREMLKACFTEEDYAKKSHCNDENWSVLNLKFNDDGKEYLSWTFITKSYNWPAFKDKSFMKMEISESISYPFQSNEQQ